MLAEPVGGTVRAVEANESQIVAVTRWCAERLPHLADHVLLALAAEHNTVARENLENGLAELLAIVRSGELPFDPH